MKTHRDEINNMSNEELVNWYRQRPCLSCANNKYEHCGRRSCTKGMIEWLNMEVEE